MVLYVVKWNLDPDKVEAYAKWVKSAIQRQMAVKGVVELRAYRMAAGTHRLVATYEFADMAAWAAWQSHEDIEKSRNELNTFASDVTAELWGPSPNVPVPIRPGLKGGVTAERVAG
jgi:quinol monooxygenase YgiN